MQYFDPITDVGHKQYSDYLDHGGVHYQTNSFLSIGERYMTQEDRGKTLIFYRWQMPLNFDRSEDSGIWCFYPITGTIHGKSFHNCRFVSLTFEDGIMTKEVFTNQPSNELNKITKPIVKLEYVEMIQEAVSKMSLKNHRKAYYLST